MKLLIVRDDRLFEYVRAVDYVRDGGATTHLAAWRTACRTCGALFEITTPAAIPAIERSKAFGTVNCPQHRISRKKGHDQVDHKP